VYAADAVAVIIYISWSPARILARGDKVFLLSFLSVPSPVSILLLPTPPLLPAPSSVPFVLCCKADPLGINAASERSPSGV